MQQARVAKIKVADENLSLWEAFYSSATLFLKSIAMMLFSQKQYLQMTTVQKKNKTPGGLMQV